MKKFLSLLVVSILILTGAGAAAVSITEIDTDINWGQTESNAAPLLDELDQSQPDMDWFGPVGPCPLVSGVPNYILAQSFTPTKNVLTKVELMIAKNSTTTYDFEIAIRATLEGPDLTSTSIHASEVTTENFSWEVLDFTNIGVNPGNTYYIVASTENTTDNWYAWGLKMDGNSYTTGTIYYSLDDEVTWLEESGGDMTFKTYGTTNHPPGGPTITGEQNGKVGTPYTYTIVATDPDGDNVYYCIDWGDGTPEVCIGPYASDEEATATHTWTEKGTYTVKAKTKDIYNEESTWIPLVVTMPKSRALTNPLFLKILERLLDTFPMLKHILGL